MTVCGLARDTVLTNRQTEKLNFDTNYITSMLNILRLSQNPTNVLSYKVIYAVVGNILKRIPKKPRHVLVEYRVYQNKRNLGIS
jgi:hypothetical protein